MGALMRRTIAVAAILFIAGCAARHPATNYAGAPRIVTLAPSLTEIAFAIGCGSELVGDTRFDDFPDDAMRLPHVADLTHVDLERLTQLRPSDAIALHDQEREGTEISGSLPSVTVTYLPNRNLTDLYDDVKGVGRICGRDRQAAALAASISERIAAISGRALRSDRRPRVLYILGLPGFTVGKNSYLNDLIELAGGVNVAGDIDQPYPNLSAESIVAMNPDILILARDTPFGPDVRRREPWRSVKAVRDGRVVTPPNDDIIERPGPRVVQGLEWLAHAIH